MEAAEEDQNESSGTYTLRDLIKDVPLSTGDNGEQAHITCVDAWSDNLYIGTSSGEVLHYVSIPPDPADDSSQPSYIFATKLEPPYTTKQEGSDEGVKQILLLPDAGKACILCNGTYTFYTLPELSPAFDGKYKQSGCTWVGGLDLDQAIGKAGSSAGGTVIAISLKQKLRLIKIGKEARRIRDIELSNVSAIQRRGDLACVADGVTYALLDVVNQRKSDLFPISSLSPPEPEKPLPEPPRPSQGGHMRSFSSASPARQSRSHERNVSLGAEPTLRPGSSSPWPARRSSKQITSPAQPSSRDVSPAKATEASPRSSAEVQQAVAVPTPSRPLPPHIASPTPNEFLLTTGTKTTERSVGMFVNLDGDPSRGTIEFSSYPESMVLDGPSSSADPSSAGAGEDLEGYVLAIVRRNVTEGVRMAIEIQRWDAEPGEADQSKEWLMFGAPLHISDDEEAVKSCGLRVATNSAELSLPEIGNSLRLRRLNHGDNASDADAKRNEEEDKFAARFTRIQANVLFYTSNKISWVTKDPLISRLEWQLSSAVKQSNARELSVDSTAVQKVVNSIRGQEARNELDFLTLAYVRQKASLLLFGNLVLQTAKGVIAYEQDKRSAEEALVSGDVDPRVVVNLVPSLVADVKEGEHGIWVSQGLRDTIVMLQDAFNPETLVQDTRGAYGDNLLAIIKRYLLTWRKKKGMASVADETYVFQTVDAALLHVLLLLDQNSPRGPATAGSVRAELNDVVDRGVDCFDRAVELFEQFSRLYMLSRLYQKFKMVAQVLATWKRILEGERDAGGELIEGEQDLRRYLTKIRDQALVQEYGAWLANRNPKLGVQIFADDSSRVKFQPSDAVAILKDKAPGAVKDYLEHMVFGKNHVQYVNDLIAFYLDTVLNELKTSDEARNTLVESYETYRALHPPKPTYRQFITDNASGAEWQRNRLRLLQLIGGSHGAASKYDVHTLGQRLAPYSDELVPEMIILNGREGKHEEALRLLTHGLGDYDTAIRYCLLGGSSIFHPSSNLGPEEPLPSKEEQSQLFEYLLHEFLRIDDLSERLERTAELLERFGAWFDVGKVLALIPDGWSIELVSGFLVRALKRLVREKNETTIVKALASAQNLRGSVGFIEKIAIGPTIVTAEVGAG